MSFFSGGRGRGEIPSYISMFKLDLLKVVGKKTYSPNGSGLLVIYHGRIRKQSP